MTEYGINEMKSVLKILLEHEYTEQEIKKAFQNQFSTRDKYQIAIYHALKTMQPQYAPSEQEAVNTAIKNALYKVR